MENSFSAEQFIEQIWNKKSFELIDHFLHPAFKDHSLISKLPPNKEGLVKWINATSASFDHETVIEAHVKEGDQVMVRIKMKLRHIGAWRGIAPTGITLHTSGYRQFKIKDGRIIEHWALIDGESIARQLTEASQSCTIAR